MKRRILASLTIPLLLAACGGAPPPPQPTTLALTIIGGPTQNPGPNGAAQPVAVRIYPLAASGKFNAADAYSLMGNATTLLGTDLAGPSDQVIVSPGVTVKIDHALPSAAQKLGIVVLFQSINQAHWRVLAPIASHKTNTLTLRIDGLTATIAANTKKG